MTAQAARTVSVPKRIIALFMMCTAMLIGVACFGVSQAHADYQWGPLMYRQLNDGTLQITRYRSGATDTNITIPKQIDHQGTYRDVSSIQYGAFRQIEHLQKVTVNAEIKSIPDVCFYKCPNLQEVNLPTTVESVGKVSFYGCSGLTTISFGGDSSRLAEIGEQAFYGCAALESIPLPSGLVAFGTESLAQCSSLKSVTIPQGVSVLPYALFRGCSALETVTFDAESGSMLKTIGENAFDNCKALQSIELPNSVTTIEKDAFRYCQGMTSAPLPSGLTTLGDSAFSYCNHLSNVGQIPESLTTIGTYVFANCAIEYIALPDTITELPKGMFFACIKLKSIALPGTLKKIGNEAFESCKSLEYLRVPGSVTSIGNYAFKKLDGAKIVYFENGNHNWAGAYVFGDKGYYNDKGLTIVCNSTNPIEMCRNEALALGADFKRLDEAGMYTVAHDKNGGSGSMGNVVLPAGMAYALPLCKFTKDAADFKEWKAPNNVCFQPGQAMPGNSSGTVAAMAIWDDWGASNSYTVNFSPNGGSGAMNSITVKKETAFTMPVCMFTAPANKTFGWWSYTLGGVEYRYGEGAEVYPGNVASLSVKAQWTGQYTVTFNANGGTVSPGTMKTNGNGRLESWPAASRPGYVFVCWSLGDDEAGQVSLGHVYTGNTTVNAVWEKASDVPAGGYLITFDAAGGVLPATEQTALTDASGRLSSLPTPTRDGYTFNYWKMPDGTKVTTSTAFTAPTTVTALWTEGSSGGGSGGGSATNTGVAMHRLYNPNSGEHFYTASDSERDYLVSLGWNSEGDGWTAPATSNTPVHRLYNANGGEHHYTMDAGERDWLVSLGWNDEGIGWYSDDNKTVPLYRDYNPNQFSNNHNYTTSVAEHEWLVSLGWRAEGYAWYGI